jgi:hypothetical protein
MQYLLLQRTKNLKQVPLQLHLPSLPAGPRDSGMVSVWLILANQPLGTGPLFRASEWEFTG